ncbi:MAG: hypothetical protein GF329_20845 [Candidatus Lokiarchaeota archaeon]|nr:hypothetical protein [Candidatus Lokiarchaeota archaeon]
MGNLNFDRAGLVLSIDRELAWGHIPVNPLGDKTINMIFKNYIRPIKSYDTLIALFKKYNITVTWAFVGFNFSKRGNRKHHRKDIFFNLNIKKGRCMHQS